MKKRKLLTIALAAALVLSTSCLAASAAEAPDSEAEPVIVSESYVGTWGNMTDKFVITSDEDLSNVTVEDVVLEKALVHPYTGVESKGAESVTYADCNLIIVLEFFCVYRSPDLVLTINDKEGNPLMSFTHDDLVIQNPNDVDKFAEGEITGDVEMVYRLYTPETAGDEALPIIIHLHGGGQQGFDNLMPLTADNAGVGLITEVVQKDHPCYVLVPQCPDKDGNWTTEIMGAILDLVDDMVAEGKVDGDRIYLTGHSMGAMGAFAAMADYPGTFAAVVPFAGRASYTEEVAKEIADSGVAIWIFHAADDFIVDPQGSRDAYQILSDAGADVKYTELPASMGLNHGSNALLATDYEPEDGSDSLFTWMFKQTTAEKPEIVSESYVGMWGNMTDKFVVTVPEGMDLSQVEAADIDLKKALVHPYTGVESKGAESVTYADGKLTIDVEDFCVYRSPDLVLTINDKDSNPLVSFTHDDLIIRNPNDVDKFAEGEITGDINVKYRLYTPETAEDAALPIIIHLHGNGQQGSDNLAPLTADNSGVGLITDLVQKDHPCYVLVPQCPADSRWTTEIVGEILDLVDGMVADGKVDGTRIYLTGHSMGAYGVFEAIADYPGKFAAAVPFAGGCDYTDEIAGLVADSGVAIWIFHAADDFIVNPEESRQAYQILSDAGADVYYTELPESMGLNHGSNALLATGYQPDDGHDDLFTWMFKQVSDGTALLPFTDVKTSNWFYAEVAYAYEAGLMNGVGGGRFDPHGDTSRAMVATILYRLAGEPTLSEEALANPFTDVNATSWYGNAVYWARENDIITGYSANTFGGSNAITRQELAVMLYRYAQFKGYDVTASADLSGYNDADEISGWAENALAWAVGEGLIQGSEGGVNPRGNASRAETAAILMRFMENLAQ